jgi:hypothetical protein
MPIIQRGAVLALAGALLAGCGGSSDPRPAGGTGDPAGPTALAAQTPADQAGGSAAPDPCALLTAEEVAAAAGGEVIRVDGPKAELRGQQCGWLVPHAEFGEDLVQLNVWVGAEFYSPEGPGAGMTGFQPVDGIGDVAHLWPNLMGHCGVIFMQGQVVVQIGLDGADSTCLDLARAAAGRL